LLLKNFRSIATVCWNSFDIESVNAKQYKPLVVVYKEYMKFCIKDII